MMEGQEEAEWTCGGNSREKNRRLIVLYLKQHLLWMISYGHIF